MRLTMKARQEVTKASAGQYRGASKKEKSKILDQFIATTGYSRWYARLVLRHEGRRIQTDKQTIVMVERTERAGEEFGTIIAQGYCTTSVTGRKSATGS